MSPISRKKMVRINFEIEEDMRDKLQQALFEDDSNIRRFFTGYAKAYLKKKKKIA
jgi:hypothetical protein